MDILKTNLFPYMEGLHMFNKKDATLTIRSVTMDRLPDHRGSEVDKPVLHFAETDKGLVLNKTNVKVLVKLLGRETDEWRGKKIQIGHEWVKAFGDTVHAVRVRDVQLNGKAANGNNGKKDAPAPPAETLDPAELDLLSSVNAQCDNYYNHVNHLINGAKRVNPDIDPDNLADPANVEAIIAAAIEYASVPPALDAPTGEAEQEPLFADEAPARKYE